MNDIQDDELISEFVQEGLDHLETIEPDLLQMEQSGQNVSEDVINRIFRAIHSIKGASGFLKLEALATLSHVMENILMKFRSGDMMPDPDNIDALLQGIDKAREMIEDIQNCNNIPYDAELNRLNAVLGSGEVSAPEIQASEAPPSGEPVLEHDEILDELSKDSIAQIKVVKERYETLNQPDTSPDDIKAHAGAIVKKVNEMQNGANFFSIDPIYQLTDLLLDLFEALREGKREPHPASTGPVIKVLDKISDIFTNIYSYPSISFNSELDALKAYLDGKIPDEVPPNEPESPVPSPDNAQTDILKTQETVRISVDLIDRMMNLAGELVLSRNQLRQEVEQIGSQNTKLAAIIQSVDVVTSEIQEKIMQMRMQPIGKLLNKFNRIVRDLSRQLQKEVTLIIEGQEVELDKTILEGLSDPLTHIIRNSLDHGIESPATRVEKGKPPAGRLHINTFHEGGQVNILVQDDGRGINTARVVDKAVANGIITLETAKTLTETEKINLILLPGMSTAEKVSDISGRGVGMDVVKTNIENLGGHIEVESEPGQGTSLLIRLPLTLAIMPSLVVGANGRKFAIPQVNVQELILIRSKDITKKIEKIGAAEVLRLRERILPLVSLSEVLGIQKTFRQPVTEERLPDRRKQLTDRRIPHETDDLHETGNHEKEMPSPYEHESRFRGNRRQSWRNDINVVVVKLGTQNFGLIVDELFDNEEIVVKPLSTHIKDCRCFAGATIMGDGKVAMILDVMGIAEASNLRFSDITLEEERRKKESARKSGTASECLESILLFNNAFEEYFALPLNRISRLELISSDAVYTSGNRNYLNYRDEGLPLIYLEDLIPIRPFPDSLEEFYLIIPKTGDHTFGIVVSQIMDTVEIAANLRKDATTPRGLSGTAIVDGEFTMFLNPDELITMIQEKYTVA